MATAARDRQLGPLPEQRPTGWHRLVFDNPPRPVPTAELADPDAAARPEPEPDPVTSLAPVVRAMPPDAAELAATAVTRHPGADRSDRSDRSDRFGEPSRRQVGRVLDPRPNRGRRWMAVALATIGAVAAAGVGALLLVTARPAPSEPAPRPVVPSTVGSSPSTVGSSPLTAAGAAPAVTPAPTPAESASAPATTPTVSSISIDPVDSAPPAVVLTLTPGDAGFGRMSTAFGSAVGRPPAG